MIILQGDVFDKCPYRPWFFGAIFGSSALSLLIPGLPSLAGHPASPQITASPPRASALGLSTAITFSQLHQAWRHQQRPQQYSFRNPAGRQLAS
jgi:hypothetical protein